MFNSIVSNSYNNEKGDLKYKLFNDIMANLLILL